MKLRGGRVGGFQASVKSRRAQWVTMAEQPSASTWAVDYAQGTPEFLRPPEGDKVGLTLLTDPWSVWCWGFEPVRRTLELRCPSVEFTPLVGGMFPELPDPEAAGFDVERFFANVQRTTGMPIRTDATTDDRPHSTYPACVHVHAVRLLAPESERAYLRKLREAAYLDARNVSRAQVAASVAANVGIEEDAFQEAMLSGEPEREFRERLGTIHELDLHSYPTLLVTTDLGTTRIEGFQSLPGILGMLERVTERLHPLVAPPELPEIIPEGERLATREVAEVLGVSLEEAFRELESAEEADLVTREEHPAGFTWRRH